MPRYLAKYTIYFVSIESDVEHMRPIFELNRKNFGKNEKWKLKTEYYHDFVAQDEKKAIEIAENRRKSFYSSSPSTHNIGANLEELLEVREIQLIDSNSKKK